MEKCPYHCCGQRIPPQIRGLHLMYHRKSYHGDFTTCKYNPHHWIPTAEYPLHEGICPDRQLVEDVLKEQKAMIIARGQCQLAFKDQTTVNAVAKKALNAEVEVFMHDTKKHRTISGDSGIETEESPTVIPNTAVGGSVSSWWDSDAKVDACRNLFLNTSSSTNSTKENNHTIQSFDSCA